MSTIDQLRAILEPTEPPNFPAYRAERERRILASTLVDVLDRCKHWIKRDGFSPDHEAIADFARSVNGVIENGVKELSQ